MQLHFRARLAKMTHIQLSLSWPSPIRSQLPGYGLVIFAIATRRRLRTNSTMLLACLASTDLLTGLVAQLITVAVEINRILGAGPFCLIQKTQTVAVVAAGFASVSHLVVLSGDRYIAIKLPLRYPSIVTIERIATTVLLAWAFTAAVTIQEIGLASVDSEAKMYSIYLDVSAVVLAIILILFIGFIVLSSGYIFLETRRQRKRLVTEQLPHEEVKRIKEAKYSAKTLLVNLLALLLTYLPTIIIVALNISLHLEPRTVCLLWSWVSTCALLGSVCNPIIYCWRVKKLLRAFLEILHLRHLKNPPQIGVNKRQQSKLQPVTSRACSVPSVKQEAVAMSINHMQIE